MTNPAKTSNSAAVTKGSARLNRSRGRERITNRSITISDVNKTMLIGTRRRTQNSIARCGAAEGAGERSLATESCEAMGRFAFSADRGDMTFEPRLLASVDAACKHNF